MNPPPSNEARQLASNPAAATELADPATVDVSPQSIAEAVRPRPLGDQLGTIPSPDDSEGPIIDETASHVPGPTADPTRDQRPRDERDLPIADFDTAAERSEMDYIQPGDVEGIQPRGMDASSIEVQTSAMVGTIDSDEQHVIDADQDEATSEDEMVGVELIEDPDELAALLADENRASIGSSEHIGHDGADTNQSVETDDQVDPDKASLEQETPGEALETSAQSLHETSIDAMDEQALADAVEMMSPRFPEPDPELVPREPRVIALMNQKGGVGKTTSAVNIGAALSNLGMRVLLIDLDPQGHLSLHMGLEPDTLEASVYDLLTDDSMSSDQVLYEINDHLAVIPAEVNLAGAETELAPKMVTGSAQRILKSKVLSLLNQMVPVTTPENGPERAQEDTHGETGNDAVDEQTETPAMRRRFDYVLIDCPPSLGLLTINALTFANEVIVPMQSHFLALQGLSKLLETVSLIKNSFNPDLTVAGMVLCMHEKQTLLAQEIMADLDAFLNQGREQNLPWRDAIVYAPAIRRNIKLAESPSFGQTIFDYEPESNGAKDYLGVAQCVAEQARTPAE